MGNKLETIECQFNLFNEGRQYTGNHRKYVLDNAMDICNSPATREKIKLREALGYYGHGRRILAKKMNLQEIEAITMPDGTKMVVSNIPSNVTTAFSIAQDGTVTHTQEILANETGKIVSELHKSRIGGFSWACPGRDGGSVGATRLTGFSGYDYVLSPNFSLNRGYVLESSSSFDKTAILESVAKATNMDDRTVEELFDGWVAQAQLYATELEDRLEEAEIYESALLDRMTVREREFSDLDESHRQAMLDMANERASKKALVDFIIEASPFFIPEDIKHAMMESDFDKARPIFESAKSINFNQFPIGNLKPEKVVKPETKEDEMTSQAGWDI